MASNRLTETVRRLLLHPPASLRSLARRAGVSHTLLGLIRDGKRAATPEVTVVLAAALERHAQECGAAAARLRRALTSRGRKR